jgi:hypothetical protein
VNAIADGVDLVLAGHLLDHVEGGQRALPHVLLEAHLGVPLVRINPGDHEHGEALVDAPLDEGLFRVQIEHVELVDPRRADHERRLQHRRRRRRVLNELHQLVFEDHLAGRNREILADLEFLGIRLPDLQVAAAGFDVLGEHLHAARKVFRAGAHRLAQQFRIGQHEVRRRQRIGELPDVELGLVPRMRVKALRVGDEPLGPVGAEKVGLLDEVEELVGGPFRIGEALVPGVGRNHRLELLAGHPLGCRAEQFEIGAAQSRLQLDRARRVRQPVLEHLPERLDHVGDFVGRTGLDLAFLARLEIRGERLPAALDHPGEVLGKGLDVDRRELGRAHHRRRCLRSCRHVVLHALPPSKLYA